MGGAYRGVHYLEQSLAGRMDDALFAKLLGMGFELDRVQRCYEALSVTASFNLQRATEW